MSPSLPRPPAKPSIDLATFAREQGGPSSRRFSTDAPTMPPPPSAASSGDVEIEITDESPLDMRSTRDPFATMTDDNELETARRRSAASTTPPRLSADHALSLANRRAPSVFPSDAPPSTRRAPEGFEAELDDVSDTPTAPPPPELMDVIAKERGPEPIVEMRERVSLGDYTGALQIAEAIIHEHPGNAEAVRCAEQCRDVLITMYKARLGPMSRAPIMIVPRTELQWVSMDHRAGFVLSHIDGIASLELLLDVSGMAPLDCLRILYELVQQKIIGFR